MISDVNLFIVLIIENIKAAYKKMFSEIKKFTYEKSIRITPIQFEWLSEVHLEAHFLQKHSKLFIVKIKWIKKVM